MPLVAGPGEGEHDEAGKDIRRSDQAVCRGGAKTHTVLENDGQEVGDGVGDCGGEHEDESKAQDLREGFMLDSIIFI